ncbi:MAG: sensor histidine kinase, partial [Bacteroidota bacterium]
QWLSNIGNTMIKQGKYIQAEKYLKEALSYDEVEGDKAVVLTNLGKVYIETGRYEMAERILDSAIAYGLKYQQMIFLSEAYFRKYELEKNKKNYKSALDYFISYHDLQDSMLNVKKTEQIAHLKVRYETEQKEKELLKEKAQNEKLAKEKALIELAVYNRNRWILAIASFSLIIILIALVVSQRHKRKAQAEKDAAIIDEREKGIQAIFNAQEEERQRIARDLHDGVGQQVSAVKMFFQNLAEKLIKQQPEIQSELEKIKQMIDETGKDVRTISHQMMPRALTELGLIDALEDMIDKSFFNSGIECHFEHYNIEERLPQRVEIGLYRIAQELLNNIMKHSGAKKVDIQLMKMEKHCVLIIQDNGKGISDNEDKGIGMLNIKNRLRTLNGEMNMESETGEGTTATIRIALA